MQSKSIKADIGFSGAEIMTHQRQSDVLDVIVMAWNARKMLVAFRSAVRVHDKNAHDIEDIRQVLDASEFLTAAMEDLYEIVPKVVPFRHYQFMGLDGEPVLEVVAEDVEISIEGQGS